jgi:hypothetical protein
MSTAVPGGSMSATSAPAEIVVHLATSKFDEDDERWLAQRNSFYAELRRETGAVSLRPESVPGSKGAVEAIILALGTAGAFRAATTCFQEWLARDRTRRIELQWNRNGESETFVIEGRAIDDEIFNRLASMVTPFNREP